MFLVFFMPFFNSIFYLNNIIFFYYVALVSAIQQYRSAIMTDIPSLLRLPPLPHSIPPCHHRAPDWAPYATHQLLTSHPPSSVCILMLLSPLVPLSPPPPSRKIILMDLFTGKEWRCRHTERTANPSNTIFIVTIF